MRPAQIVSRSALIIVGVINFIPLVGVISSSQLSQMYGIDIDSANVSVLLRHRAVLFGLLGAFIIYSAFKPSLQMLAAAAGFVAMISFIVLTYTMESVGDEIRKVALVDIVATVLLLGWLLTAGRTTRNVD